MVIMEIPICSLEQIQVLLVVNQTGKVRNPRPLKTSQQHMEVGRGEKKKENKQRP